MAFCSNCGTHNSDSAAYCINCGARVENQSSNRTTSSTPPSAPASSKSIIALILGIVSIVMSCGPVTGVAAIIMANQELRAIRDGLSPEAGKTLAQVALWTGWIGTVLCTFFWIVYVGIIVLMIGAGGFWN